MKNLKTQTVKKTYFVTVETHDGKKTTCAVLAESIREALRLAEQRLDSSAN